jgi:hypothetical protein
VIPFVIGAALAYGALAAWTQVSGTEWEGARPELIWPFIGMLPTLVTFAVADALQLARPKWTLDRRAGRRLRALCGGAFAGALGAVAMSVAFASGAPVPASVVIVGCPAIATLLAVLPMRPLRPGWCVGCGYDLRAATVKTGTSCPECGMAPA